MGKFMLCQVIQGDPIIRFPSTFIVVALCLSHSAAVHAPGDKILGIQGSGKCLGHFVVQISPEQGVRMCYQGQPLYDSRWRVIDHDFHLASQARYQASFFVERAHGVT